METTKTQGQTPWMAYWGKAKPSRSEGPEWHPLVYHCLDVAASGAVLLERDPRLMASLVRTAQVPEEQLRRWIPFVLAIHDLGKFSVPFQCQVPELARKNLGWTEARTYQHRHDTIGYLFFKDIEEGAVAWLADDQRLSVGIDGSSCSGAFDLLDALGPWMMASCGHHGRPPAHADFEPWLYPNRARQDAKSWVGALLDLMQPGHLDVNLAAMQRSSWLIAGLAVLADWVGSNQDFFRYQPPTLSLEDYWKHAEGVAQQAVTSCGLLPATPVSSRSPVELLPKLKEPTPLQTSTATLPLAQGPQLWLLEDVTGSGKTEAALLLAHRLMAAGLADGIYFALPTMATANGMYRRIDGVFARFFTDEPSLTLAHGKTTLYKALQEAPRDINPDGENLSASRHGAAWLADNRKKSLLASVGVGTIDQAMLAVLPSKHSPLRMLGLHRKVLIVDEVHACDVYMGRILQNLLEFQASLGGSAILLSATLPRAFRQQLCRAFQAPLARQDTLVMDNYPLLTVASGEGLQEHECEAAKHSRREVTVSFLHQTEEVLTRLRETAREGGCAVWIRNTVADAMEAFQSLQDQAGVHLFHARFVAGDRQRIEDENLARFGLDSGPAERRGQILIATQVVEQSLDLDFDVMISDLAPVELLIQRAGRLHRHPRMADGVRLEHGPDLRPPPVLHVLAPPFDDNPDAGWLHRSPLRRTALVYENPVLLWATQQTLARLGAIRTPLESRTLIEEVHNTEAPAGLAKQENKAIGQQMTRRSHADMNALPFSLGYQRDSQRWLDDTRVPTRLGDETTTVRLCRIEDGRAAPFFQHPTLGPHLRWQLSEVSIRASLITEPLDSPYVTAARQAMPDEGRWCVPIVVTPAEGGSWQGQARDGDGAVVGITYSAVLGFVSTRTSNDPE